MAGLFRIGTKTSLRLVLVVRKPGIVVLCCGLKPGSWRTRNGLRLDSVVLTLVRPLIPVVTLCGPRGIRLEVGWILVRLAWFS